MNLADIVAGMLDAPGAGLRAVDDLARAIQRIRWFSAVGKPLTAEAAAAIDALLSVNGAAGTEILRADSWSWSRWLHDRHRHDGAIEREFALELRHLRALGAAKHGADLLDAVVADVTGLAYATAHGAAAGAALLGGVRDPQVAKLAAEDVRHTVHGAGLALAAGVPYHAFVAWLGILETGYWPIGTVDGKFWVF